MNTISIIIPVYNTEKYLRRCLDSALNQSFEDFEIIVVDDGSPDNAGVIADEYASRFERVKVIHQANAGLSEARKTGILNSTGEYVFFLDSDDDLPADAIEKIYNRAAENNLDICYGTYNRIIDGKITRVDYPEEKILDQKGFVDELMTIGTRCGSGGFNLSKRALWHDDVFLPSDVVIPSEDVMTYMRLSRYVGRVGLFNDLVYNYYFVSNSLSAGGRLSKYNLWKKFFRLLRDELGKRGFLETLENKVKIMEIDRLSFYNVKDVDKDDEWYKQIVNYSNSGFPKRTRMLQRLLKAPSLLRFVVAVNRRIKRILKFN